MYLLGKVGLHTYLRKVGPHTSQKDTHTYLMKVRPPHAYVRNVGPSTHLFTCDPHPPWPLVVPTHPLLYDPDPACRSPTPRVSWARTGARMSPRARTESFGQELIIDNIQFVDAGKYECEAINTETPTPSRQSFVIKVECQYPLRHFTSACLTCSY